MYGGELFFPQYQGRYAFRRHERIFESSCSFIGTLFQLKEYILKLNHTRVGKSKVGSLCGTKGRTGYLLMAFAFKIIQECFSDLISFHDFPQCNFLCKKYDNNTRFYHVIIEFSCINVNQNHMRQIFHNRIVK